MGKNTENRILTYEDFEEQHIIKTLPEPEYKDYIGFHEDSYKEDLKVADKLVAISPKWVIISGYYAMHDITKLYLAKIHSLRISGRYVHAAVIVALRKVLESKEVREKAVKLLDEAQKIYDVFQSHRKEKIIPSILSGSREERGKAQYYSGKPEKIMIDKAMRFIEQVVKPYIELIEKMM